MENGFFLTLGFVLYVPTSFRVHLALRGLLGVVSVSVTYAGLILAIEFVDGKWRTIAGMYNLFPLPVRLYEAKILCSRILKFQNNKIWIQNNAILQDETQKRLYFLLLILDLLHDDLRHCILDTGLSSTATLYSDSWPIFVLIMVNSTTNTNEITFQSPKTKRKHKFFSQMKVCNSWIAALAAMQGANNWSGGHNSQSMCGEQTQMSIESGKNTEATADERREWRGLCCSI